MKKIVLLSLTLLALASCGENGNKEKSQRYTNYGVFGSMFTVDYISDTSINDQIDEFLNTLTVEADPYSSHTGVNGVYALNLTNEPVEVSENLYTLLSKSWAIKEETNGSFNPLIYDLSSLWKKTLFGGIIADPDYTPTSAKIDEAKTKVPAILEKMANSSLSFNETNRTVQRVGEAKIDLGGVTKGYAVEAVDKMLRDAGITAFLINGGVSSLGLGKSGDGGSFGVKLQYTGKDTIYRYILKDTYTTCSAIYEQFRIVDGVTYSHVISPITGLPVSNYSMAFLVGEDSTRIDAYATACMVSDLETAKGYMDSKNYRGAIFEDDHGIAKMVYSNIEAE